MCNIIQCNVDHIWYGHGAYSIVWGLIYSHDALNWYDSRKLKLDSAQSRLTYAWLHGCVWSSSGRSLWHCTATTVASQFLVQRNLARKNADMKLAIFCSTQRYTLKVCVLQRQVLRACLDGHIGSCSLHIAVTWCSRDMNGTAAMVIVKIVQLLRQRLKTADYRSGPDSQVSDLKQSKWEPNSINHITLEKVPCTCCSGLLWCLVARSIMQAMKCVSDEWQNGLVLAKDWCLVAWRHAQLEFATAVLGTASYTKFPYQSHQHKAMQSPCKARKDTVHPIKWDTVYQIQPISI